MAGAHKGEERFRRPAATKCLKPLGTSSAASRTHLTGHTPSFFVEAPPAACTHTRVLSGTRGSGCSGPTQRSSRRNGSSDACPPQQQHPAPGRWQAGSGGREVSEAAGSAALPGGAAARQQGRRGGAQPTRDARPGARGADPGGRCTCLRRGGGGSAGFPLQRSFLGASRAHTVPLCARRPGAAWVPT